MSNENIQPMTEAESNPYEIRLDSNIVISTDIDEDDVLVAGNKEFIETDGSLVKTLNPSGYYDAYILGSLSIPTNAKHLKIEFCKDDIILIASTKIISITNHTFNFIKPPVLENISTLGIIDNDHTIYDFIIYIYDQLSNTELIKVNTPMENFTKIIISWSEEINNMEVTA